MNRKLLLLGALASMGLALVTAAATPASAVSVLPPSITAKPDNVMVNTGTTLTGRNFTPGRTLHIVECSKTNWIVPKNPCDTNNAVKVTTNAKGGFKTKMKVEACPASDSETSGGLSELCYVGVPKPSGIDTIALVPRTKIVVTFP
jgi:hypothetical protein